MKLLVKSLAVTTVTLSLLMMINFLSFAQEASSAPGADTAQPVSPEQSVSTPAEVTQPQKAETDTQWLWGEVVSVDAKAGEVVLKYIDYETDSEKNITVATTPDTTYENITGLNEIKEKDTASIDYLVSKDGRNLAKHISIERMENLPEQPAGEAPSADSSASADTAVPTPKE